jgi:folylpolyglutamate synthase/dihydropteroate synthase
VVICTDIAAALDAALAASRTICVAGSIFLAGAVRERLVPRDILP